MTDWRKMTEEEIVIAEEIAALLRFRELNVKYHGCFIRDGKVIGCLENAKGCHGGGIVPDLGDTKTRILVANALLAHDVLSDSVIEWAMENFSKIDGLLGRAALAHISARPYSC